MRDVIIVGSGPAGASAALALAGRDVLMLDAGHEAPSIPSDFSGNLLDLRRESSDLTPHLVGEEFQSMQNLFVSRKVNLKLKSPYMGYIIRDWQNLSPIVSDNFDGVVSLAKGGLANGWGGGVYRFTDEDLASFPVGYSELAPYYDLLTEHVGVSGTNDDLEPWLIHDDNLQEPHRLSPMAQEFMERYGARRQDFHDEGVYFGRARVALLTREHRGRRPYAYDRMEFFRPRDPALYTPAYTVEELVQAGRLEYRPGLLVQQFKDTADGVEIVARPVGGGDPIVFRARKLLLGAGAINTARIVLASAEDRETRLPLLDNALACFPVFRFGRLGKAMSPEDISAGQMMVLCEEVEGVGTVQGSFYGTTGPLRSDVLFDLPLPAGVARTLLKLSASATSLIMLFYPGVKRPGNYLRLRNDGALDINYAPEVPTGALERKLIKNLRKVNYFSHRALIQYPPMGSGLHYAGMLPMSDNPGRYECHPDGRLSGAHGVHVIDGACFSALPSKNLTFTIMANAMRIAEAAVGAS